MNSMPPVGAAPPVKGAPLESSAKERRCTGMFKLDVLKAEDGQTLLEYILIGALVVLGVIAVLITTSGAIRSKFTQINNCLNAAGTSGASC